jgi:NAD(P)-dependent dehydrogenase (short-subunit alcohol dehydrogenase family)
MQYRFAAARCTGGYVKQKPIPSGYGFRTTADEVMRDIDPTGKVAIVTGGYSGIGLETTRTLTQAGATVVVPVRTPEKAKKSLASLKGHVEIAKIDLLNPETIDSFAKEFLASDRPLHLLINNAGIMAIPLSRDRRGYEAQLSANHLGHFQLTLQLWQALQRANGARVVNLSSGAHRQSAFDFSDPNFEHRNYDKWKAYAQSKTATALFTVALDKRGLTQKVRSFAAHPGRIVSDLQRSIPMEELQSQGLRDERGEIPADQKHLYKSVEQGAATTTWCAVSPQLDGRGGVYCEDVDIARAVPADHKEMNGVLPWAIDHEAAERLWQLSEQLTHVSIA